MLITPSETAPSDPAMARLSWPRVRDKVAPCYPVPACIGLFVRSRDADCLAFSNRCGIWFGSTASSYRTPLRLAFCLIVVAHFWMANQCPIGLKIQQSPAAQALPIKRTARHLQNGIRRPSIYPEFERIQGSFPAN